MSLKSRPWARLPRLPQGIACGLLLWAAAAAPAQPGTAASPAPMAELVAEARERRLARTPSSQPWRTLTRERLAQMLQGDDLTLLPPFEGLGAVIDQAGAWDLLRFDKPSDVRAQWWRWTLPAQRRVVDPAAARQELPLPNFGLHADAAYSDEAGAFVALWNCLPPAAWFVTHQHPMLWALEQVRPWDEASAADFGGCVRQQSETSAGSSPNAAATVRGMRSARLIADRLISHLQHQGCSGSGPDDCLVVLQALLSLAPTRPELPALGLRVLDHHRRLLGEVPGLPRQPPALAGRPDAALHSLVLGLRRDLMHRVLLLDLALRLQFAQPQASVLAPQESVAGLLTLVERQSLLDALQGEQGQPRLRGSGPWTPPWQALKRLTDQDDRWASAQAGAITAMAAQPGCQKADALIHAEPAWPDPNLWLHFAARRLPAGLPDCQALQRAGLAASYRDPAAWQARPQSGLAADALRALQALLGDEARSGAHRALLQHLAPACPLAFDPWSACRWVSADHRRLSNPNRRLPLRAADRFTARPVWTGVVGNDPGRLDRLLPALQRRGLARRPEAALAVNRVVQQLQGWGEVSVGRLWRHARHPMAAVEIEVTPVPDRPAEPAGDAGSGRFVLVIDHRAAWLVATPGSWGQYDDGELSAVSDIDGDKRLELWFGGTFGECDGEGDAQAQGAPTDCSEFQVQLGGEIYGQHLLPYVPGPPAPPPR